MIRGCPPNKVALLRRECNEGMLALLLEGSCAGSAVLEAAVEADEVDEGEEA